MRDPQSLAWQTALLDQLPVPFPITLESEEAITGLQHAGDITPGNDIDMAVLVDVPQGYSWGGYFQSF